MKKFGIRVRIHENEKVGDKNWKHLNLDDTYKSAIKNHILPSFHQCCNGVCYITSFKTLWKCHSD